MAFFKGAVWTDVTVATGGTIVIPTSDAGTPLIVCVNNSAAILSLTISWPTAGVDDGQFIALNTINAITTLTHTVTGGFIQGVLTTLTAGASGLYKFRKSNLTWYKLASG